MAGHTAATGRLPPLTQHSRWRRQAGPRAATIRLRDGCSASTWTAPDRSRLLRLDALSVQTDPDGSKRIVWMIIGMIKAHPTQHRMPRRFDVVPAHNGGSIGSRLRRLRTSGPRQARCSALLWIWSRKQALGRHHEWLAGMATCQGHACDTRGGRVGRRLGNWVVITVLAAGCATPDANRQPMVNDQTDVWFAQHMVPHLLQDTSIASLIRDRLTDPELVRLAGLIHRRGQARTAQLLEWLAERGLAPHGHSHQRGDGLLPSDLEGLSRLSGAALDLAFVKVMTTRDRAGGRLAGTEARDGGVPAIRQLAQQLLVEQQDRISTLRSWRRAWSKSHASRPPAKAARHRELVVISRDRRQEQRRSTSALLDRAGRFPALVQDLKFLCVDSAGGRPVTAQTHGLGQPAPSQQPERSHPDGRPRKYLTAQPVAKTGQARECSGWVESGGSDVVRHGTEVAGAGG
jgi:uncharacterized protein (DUF305 family)